MQIDNLIIDYLNLRLEKVKFIRDKEREKSKEICSILNPNGEFVDYNTYDKIIDDYCKQVYNCSTYNYSLCIKSIERVKKLNDLGI